MDLTFNQVEEAFMKRYDLPAEKGGTFRSRLQHLQRLKFPTGVNTGRGIRAAYGWVQIVQLTVALDMLDLGLPPELVVKSVKENSDRLVSSVCEVVSSFDTVKALEKALRKGRCPFAQTRFLTASAYTFTARRDEGESLVVRLLNGREFTDELQEDPGVHPSHAVINFGSRMMIMGHLVGVVGGVEPSKLAADLSQWANHWANQDTLS